VLEHSILQVLGGEFLDASQDLPLPRQHDVLALGKGK
jgi:hypothetical protein